LVEIHSPKFGRLTNRVGLSTESAPWAYGESHLMRDLAEAQLI
jgi:fumarylacetoacetate (FAA) hydrolase family protein